MGSEYRGFSFDRIPKEEMLKRWKQKVAEDTYERGHGMYQGSLNDVREFTIVRASFDSYAAANKYLDEHEPYKGSASCAQVGNPEQFSLQHDKKGKTLEDAYNAARLGYMAFLGGTIHRVFHQKSATKGCSACGCSFSKKGLAIRWNAMSKLPKDVKPETLELKLKELISQADEDGWVARWFERDPIQCTVFSCPMCGDKDFLITATDRKRFEGLYAKSQKAKKAVEDHKITLKAKWDKVKGDHGWVILAIASC